MKRLNFVCKRVSKVPPFWKKVYLLTNGDLIFQKKGYWYIYIKRFDGSVFVYNNDYYNWKSIRIKVHYE